MRTHREESRVLGIPKVSRGANSTTAGNGRDGTVCTSRAVADLSAALGRCGVDRCIEIAHLSRGSDRNRQISVAEIIQPEQGDGLPPASVPFPLPFENRGPFRPFPELRSRPDVSQRQVGLNVCRSFRQPRTLSRHRLALSDQGGYVRPLPHLSPPAHFLGRLGRVVIPPGAFDRQRRGGNGPR
jgi:hypothetical protein